MLFSKLNFCSTMALLILKQNNSFCDAIVRWFFMGLNIIYFNGWNLDFILRACFTGNSNICNLDVTIMNLPISNLIIELTVFLILQPTLNLYAIRHFSMSQHLIIPPSSIVTSKPYSSKQSIAETETPSSLTSILPILL